MIKRATLPVISYGSQDGLSPQLADLTALWIDTTQLDAYSVTIGAPGTIEVLGNGFMCGSAIN